METIFIFKSDALGMQYGIGTYIEELTRSLLEYSDIRICLVTYLHQECFDYKLNVISDGYIEIDIPAPIKSTISFDKFEERYAKLLLMFLTPIIESSSKVVFHFNCIDAYVLHKKIKERFNHPSLFVAHFALWQLFFNGNKKRLSEVQWDNPIDDTDKAFIKDRDMYFLSDHIVAVNQDMASFLMSEYGISQEKLSVVPNGIHGLSSKNSKHLSKSTLRKKWGFNRCEKIVLFVGRVDVGKGVLFLVEAFEKACLKNPALRLIIVGSGIIPDVISRISTLYGKITFTEFVSKEKIAELYKIADIGIYPSLYDQCPYSVLEMMVNEVPLILSRISGVTEIYTEELCLYVNTVIAPNGDISIDTNELADAILDLISDKDKASKMANTAKKVLFPKFASRKMAYGMSSVYNALMK